MQKGTTDMWEQNVYEAISPWPPWAPPVGEPAGRRAHVTRPGLRVEVQSAPPGDAGAFGNLHVFVERTDFSRRWGWVKIWRVLKYIYIYIYIHIYIYITLYVYT